MLGLFFSLKLQTAFRLQNTQCYLNLILYLLILLLVHCSQDPGEPSHFPTQMLTHANNTWQMLMLAESEQGLSDVRGAFRGLLTNRKHHDFCKHGHFRKTA